MEVALDIHAWKKIRSGRKDVPLKDKVDYGGSEVFLKVARATGESP